MSNVADDDADVDAPPRPPKTFKLGSALPVLLMLVVWGLGAWFTWVFAMGEGTVSRTELRTGTMTVTTCSRSASYMFWLYECEGSTAFAPEDTWRGNPDVLRGQVVKVLSPTSLSGAVEFVTYDPRKSSKGNYMEVALPAATYARGRTFAGFLPTLGVGAGVFVGGIAIALVTHRVRRALT